MKGRNIIRASASLGAAAVFVLFSAASSGATPCPPVLIGGQGEGSGPTICSNEDQAADWQARISGAGVVWYHNFDSADEVDAFRWMGGVGNDPDATGKSQSANTSWQPTGGADGGGYLQLSRPSGTSEVPDWWRPFSPMTGASNGRGVDDPGANGTLTPQSFIATQGGSQTQNWGGGAKPGWYGHSSYQNSFFDGTDFYLQVRVKTDPRRMSGGNFQGGKKVWLTTTNASYTQQELVTYGAYHHGFSGDGAGVPNYHNVYQGFNYASLSSVATNRQGLQIQLDNETGTCEPYNDNVDGCWSYSTGWDTLLYHITPGRDGVAETRFEVWAAHPGETSYTKIWDVVYPAHFTKGASSTGQPFRNGWNALLLSAYSNGFQGKPLSAFHERYDQVIFSKAFIPPPQS